MKPTVGYSSSWKSVFWRSVLWRKMTRRKNYLFYPVTLLRSLYYQIYFCKTWLILSSFHLVPSHLKRLHKYYQIADIPFKCIILCICGVFPRPTFFLSINANLVHKSNWILDKIVEVLRSHSDTTMANGDYDRVAHPKGHRLGTKIWHRNESSAPYRVSGRSFISRWWPLNTLHELKLKFSNIQNVLMERYHNQCVFFPVVAFKCCR